MGYLMIGVRGLGLLIISWTTVVLLGGFVSDLGKKDFWCLTGILLIQTTGVLLGDMVHLSWDLLGATVSTLRKYKAQEGGDEVVSSKRLFLAFALAAIQIVGYFVILCPVSILYVFGIYISVGASLWRLKKHDFGNGDGGANMKPALQVLYSLVATQGVLLGHKRLQAFVAKNRLVKLVYHMLDKQVHEALLEEYLEETVAGCEKDPSFAIGRNLVTYGVNLMMEVKSNEGFIAGIKVLGGTINEGERGRKVLAKYLLARSDDSSRAIIQRLLETVGPKSPYNRKIKGHVVSILDIIAPCIRLEQFPRAIECLSSVVDTSEMSNEQMRYYRRDYGSKFMDYERVELLEKYEKDYVKIDLKIGSPKGTLLEKLYQCLLCKTKEAENESMREENIITDFEWLLIKAVNIIHKLVADEENLWILRTSLPSTVLHKIASWPIKLHRESHDLFEKLGLQMLEKCWEVTERLLVALIETSSPPLPPAATPVGEGRQITRRRRRSSSSREIEKVEEQLLVLRTMDGSAFESTIKHTIKLSIESAVKCILDCLDCGTTEKRQAIQFLLHLSLDMSTIVKDSDSSKRRLSWVLLLIICSNDDDSGFDSDSEYSMVPSLLDLDGIRKSAAEKLSEIMLGQKHELRSEECARELLQSIQRAHEDLESACNADSEDISEHARRIKWVLSRSDYDSRVSELQRSLVDAVPEIVTETSIPVGPITAESQEPLATDLEMGIVSQDIQDGSLDIE